ncbi:MAG: hypothetical protein OXE42_10955 [Gammaproteobacteria bacterium]|nr:hypothetical protein [Gammaproteobacteria bacterium]
MPLYTPHLLKIRLDEEGVLAAYRAVLQKDPGALERALLLTELWEDLPENLSIVTLGGIVFFQPDMMMESWLSLMLVVFVANGIAQQIRTFCIFLFPVVMPTLIPWAKLKLRYLVPVAALSYVYFVLDAGIEVTAILLVLFLTIKMIFSLPWMMLGHLYQVRARLRMALLGKPTHQEDAFQMASDFVAAGIGAEIDWGEYEKQFHRSQ